ncbi:MAG: DUF2271 domain-containing protein [Oscillospiraceae bacterium]|jgi:hypothetical protein|nr:DUF2271 domain-containing protein [Oscillospiraceae bacterium]
MKKREYAKAIIAAFLLSVVCACSGGGRNTETAPNVSASETPQVRSTSGARDNIGEPSGGKTASGEVVIAFDYKKVPGHASNQFAVWIEDMDGGYITALYVTRWTAGGGYKTRPDSVALWVEKSGLAFMAEDAVDAVSGATPKTGSLSYTWDLTDGRGEVVLPGEYRFFVEGTLRWKNYVLFSGVITLGDVPITAQADARFVYEKSDGQAALIGDSPETAMISGVTASFIPA